MAFEHICYIAELLKNKEHNTKVAKRRKHFQTIYFYASLAEYE